MSNHPTLCEDAVHAQTKLCKNMSQNNEQQQERCQACENKRQNNEQQQERCQVCENKKQNNEEQQEICQVCENMRQNNERDEEDFDFEVLFPQLGRRELKLNQILFVYTRTRTRDVCGRN